MQGPYRYLRHPNYLVVLLEMVLFPFLFGAYLTAVVMTILQLLVLLLLRIPLEEKALLEVMSCQLLLPMLTLRGGSLYLPGSANVS
jgi:methyltransferase